MHKIKLILLLILPISVFAQDLGIIDTRTTKNPALNGTYRISTDGKNLFFRNFIGLSKKVANTDSATFTGLITLPSTTSIGNVSSTELSYLDGVTSPIQTQLDNKFGLSSNNTASGNNVFTGSNKFLTPIFANSTSTSAYSSITGTWSNTGNLGVFSFRYNTKSGNSVVNRDNIITMDANGFVGIGMNPTVAFEVLGATKFNSAITATSISASETISGSNLSGTNTGDNATNTQYSGLATSKQDALNGTGFVKASGTTISYDNSTYLTTSSAGSTYLPLSGGTLTGNLTLNNGAKFVGQVGTLYNGNQVYIDFVGTSYGRIQSYNATGGFGMPLVLNGGGSNVGIGILPTTRKLEVTDVIRSIGGGFEVITPLSSGSSYQWLLNYSDNKYYLNSSTDKFVANSSTRLLVDNSGNVGIGTTSPSEKLNVTGNILASGTVLGSNLSGTNTGDNATNTQYSGLATSKQDALNGTGFIKASGTTISYDNSTYLTTSSASSTYAPIASPTFTGTVSGITKSMVGLGNVDNTSDATKPVSTATQTALDLKANLASPTFTGTVAGITKNMVGLGSVDNTTDAAKPISTATQTALDAKQATLNGTGFVKSTAGTISYDNSTYLTTSTAASTYLPISNPTATGTLTAPTISNTLGANFATTSGNVGIGTASPAYKLDVNGSFKTNSTTDLVVGGGLASIGAGAGTNTVGVEIGSNRTGTGTSYIDLGGEATNTDYGLRMLRDGLSSQILHSGTGDMNINSIGTGNLLFSTQNAEKMRINLSGNVGIGTTSPQNLLHVKGTAAQGVGVRNSHLTIESTETAGVDVGAVLKFAGQSGNTVNPYSFGTIEGKKESALTNNYSAYLAFYTMSDIGGNAERMRINGSGNVGIGTTSPSSILHTIGTIQTSSTSSASINYANRFNNIIFSRSDIPTTYTNAISNSWSGTSSDQTMNFEIGNGSSTRVTAMTLLGNGNVGIGTTTPAYKLNIAGTGYVGALIQTSTTTAGASCYFSNATRSFSIGARGDYGSTGQLNIVDETAGVLRLSVSTAGNVLIGSSASDAGFKLDVTGTSRFTSKMTINSAFNSGLSLLNGSSNGQIFNDGNMHIEAAEYLWINGNSTSLTSINAGGGNTYINGGGGRVGIGTTSPVASAVLDITSTTQGVLFPRMTTAQINAITSPANGLTVYNTSLLVLCFYDGTGWRKVSHSNM